MKRIFSVFALVCLLACSSFASTIPVTGTISLPDGSKLTGTVRLTLSYSAARDTTNNNVIVAQSAIFRVQQGTLQSTAQIVPNDVLQPANTWYTAEYFTSSGARVALAHFYISGQSFDLGSATPTPVTTSNLNFGYFTGLTDVETAIINNAQTCTRSGATGGAKIAAAIAAAPSSGAIVDCSGLQGAQTISADPFTGVTKPITLILGAATFTFSATASMPANITLHPGAGTILTTSGAATLTINGTIDAPIDGGCQQIFSGNHFNLGRTSRIPACWFGAKGDGSTDDSTAIQNSVTVATSSFGPGLNENPTVCISGLSLIGTTITVSGTNHGIKIAGCASGTAQQGSVHPLATARWTGGATPMFTVNNTYTEFSDLAMDNTGTGTLAINFASGGRNNLTNMSFLNAGTRFSSAIVGWPNGLDYSTISGCEFDTASPVFALIDGGSTWLKIEKCVFDVTSQNATVVKANSTTTNIEQLHFDTNTFNSQTNNEILALDTSNMTTGFLQNLTVRGAELDAQSTTAGHRFMKLKNVRSALFEGNHFYANGTMTSVVDVTNSTVYYLSGFLQSLNGYFFNVTDSVSNVFPIGGGYVDISNASGFINPANSAGITVMSMASSAAMNIVGQRGNPAGVSEWEIDATDATNFNINILFPAGGVGFMTKGQFANIRVCNTSGGAMGVISLNTGFNVSSGVLTSPANNNCRSLFGAFNGTAFREITRSTADIPK